MCPKRKSFQSQYADSYKPATAIIPKAIKRVHEDEDDLIQFILKLFKQSRIKILNLNYRYRLNF